MQEIILHEKMSVITVSMDLNPSTAQFINNPTDASPIPQVIYASYGSSVDNNTSYSPPTNWSGMSIGNLPLPVPGPNNVFFLCGSNIPTGPYILNVGTSSNPIGSVNVLFNATGNMSSSDLYYTFACIDKISIWPGGIIETITITISGGGTTFTGGPVYGILSNDRPNPPYTAEIFVIDDPEIAGQTTATYTGDGTLYFPPASPLYITFMYGFTPPPTDSTITINESRGSSYAATNFIFGLVNIQGPCLHGGSLVSTLDGPKRMDHLTVQDQILTSSGQYATIKEVCQCWLSIDNGSNTHQALVIEPNALAPGIPDVRTILDPGHPIGVNSESLNPAGSYAEGNDKISYALWGDVSLSSDPKLTRYDLVLEEPYRDYMVHNLVVQSRKSAKEAGYDHWYQGHY